jgi:hypothetical protein
MSFAAGSMVEIKTWAVIVAGSRQEAERLQVGAGTATLLYAGPSLLETKRLTQLQSDER